MRSAVWSLAILASIGPAFAFPGFNRGQAAKEVASIEKEIKALEAELAKLEAEGAGWEKGGSNWGHNGQGSRQSGAAGNNGRHSTYTRQSAQHNKPSTYAHNQPISSASASSAHGSSSLTGVAVAPVSQSASSTITPVPYGSYVPSEWSSSAASSTVVISHATSVYTAVYPTASQYTSGGKTLTTSF